MRKSDTVTLIDQDFESSYEEELVNIFAKNPANVAHSFSLTTPSTHLNLSSLNSYPFNICSNSPVEQSISLPSLVLQPPTPNSNVLSPKFSFKPQNNLKSSVSMTRLSYYGYDSMYRRYSTAKLVTDPFKTPELKVSYHVAKQVPEIDVEQLNEMISSTVMVDCRWPYEFEGGTITGAFNCCDAEKLPDKLISEENMGKKIVFFCEFSEVRGPKMARFFLKYCIYNNVDGFNDVYVLKDGFNGFYSRSKTNKTGGYVIEKDITHIKEMRAYSGNNKYDMNIPLEYRD